MYMLLILQQPSGREMPAIITNEIPKNSQLEFPYSTSEN